MNDDILYLGMHGCVTAINKETGEEIWRTKLKSRAVVTLTIDQERNLIFAVTYGILFCLDKSTGALIWENGLKGLGYGLAMFGSSNSEDHLAQSVAAAQAAAAANNGAGAGH